MKIWVCVYIYIYIYRYVYIHEYEAYYEGSYRGDDSGYYLLILAVVCDLVGVVTELQGYTLNPKSETLNRC